MPRLAIDREFLQDYTKLDKPVQTLVNDVFGKFEAATHTGIHLEPVQNAKDKRFRTIRINQFWRGVVLAPETGDVYTLLKVLPHDDAYEWASRRRASVNGASGRIELRDVVAIDATLPALEQAAVTASERLFDHVKDADLRRLGLDDQTLAFARALTHEIQLDAAKAFLPERQWDVLAGLLAGMSAEDVWAEIGAHLTPEEPVDTTDVVRAVERSTDRVVLVEGPAELLAVLSRPFELWRVYLHPAQQEVVDARYSGPARVTGGPGTGKTVVAMHRARRLAERLIAGGVPADGPKVLLTTFTSTLVQTLHAGLLLLVDDAAVLDRIDVLNVDRVARDVYVSAHGSFSLISDREQQELWRSVVADQGVPYTEAFLAEEWRQVVLAQEITSAEQYRLATRIGRGKPLGVRQRDQVWTAIEAFSGRLHSSGKATWESMCVEATRLLRAGGPPSTVHQYRHAVIDEAQDLSLVQWRFLRALVAPGPDDLFLAGDAHQRIYSHRVTLNRVGIQTAGRSSRLTINYRTTAEILAWSLGMLRGEPIDDLDDGLDRIAGYRSPLHGRSPARQGFRTGAAELAGLADAVRAWVERGVRPEEIGVAVRSNSLVESAALALVHAGFPVRLVAKANQSEAAISVATMHRMKGLEFRCMAVACLNDHVIPVAVTPFDVDPLTHAQDLLRERCLLFVACTRAREELRVSWYGTPSSFLADGD
jgi:superfamily I DNA/RNA helicase